MSFNRKVYVIEVNMVLNGSALFERILNIKNVIDTIETTQFTKKGLFTDLVTVPINIIFHRDLIDCEHRRKSFNYFRSDDMRFSGIDLSFLRLIQRFAINPFMLTMRPLLSRHCKTPSNEQYEELANNLLDPGDSNISKRMQVSKPIYEPIQFEIIYFFLKYLKLSIEAVYQQIKYIERNSIDKMKHQLNSKWKLSINEMIAIYTYTRYGEYARLVHDFCRNNQYKILPNELHHFWKNIKSAASKPYREAFLLKTKEKDAFHGMANVNGIKKSDIRKYYIGPRSFTSRYKVARDFATKCNTTNGTVFKTRLHSKLLFIDVAWISEWTNEHEIIIFDCPTSNIVKVNVYNKNEEL